MDYEEAEREGLAAESICQQQGLGRKQDDEWFKNDAFLPLSQKKKKKKGSRNKIKRDGGRRRREKKQTIYREAGGRPERRGTKFTVGAGL